MGAWIEPSGSGGSFPLRSVAPYVGAWIETSEPILKGGIAKVAPYVGAWIETDNVNGIIRTIESHPMWVRGLKQVCGTQIPGMV